jgi:hypothetical protein
MFHELKYRLLGPEVTVWGVFLALGGLLGIAVLFGAFVAGTFAHFSFPNFGNKVPNQCYFTDDLLLYIECPGSKRLAELLSWAWWWTWGIKWMIGFLPFSLTVLVPELIAIGLAVRLLWRLSRA